MRTWTASILSGDGKNPLNSGQDKECQMLVSYDTLGSGRRAAATIYASSER